MNEPLEFVTSKNQYLFSQVVKHIEFSFLSAVGMAVGNMFFGGSDSFQIGQFFFVIIFTVLAIFIFTIFYVNIRVRLFKSVLPKIIISDAGVYLKEFGEIKDIKWPEITKVEVKGRFRRVIRLNDIKGTDRYEIEYYLFSPQQRREIIPAILAKINPPKINHS